MKNVKFQNETSTTAPNQKNDLVGTAIEITVAVLCFGLIARALRPTPIATPVYYVVQSGGTTQQQS